MSTAAAVRLTRGRTFLRPLLMAIASLGVAAAATFADPALAPRLPLYQLNGPGCPDACFPNMPRIPVFALATGALLAMTALGASWRAVLAGIGAGTAATLVAGIFTAATIPFTDNYFLTGYRAFALLYLGAALFIASLALARKRLWANVLAWPALWALLLAILASLGRAQWAVAAVGIVAFTASLIFDRVLRRSVIPQVKPWHVALALAAIALLFRSLFGLQTLVRTGPGMAFAIDSDDGDSYYNLATAFAEGKITDVLATAAFPPGYSIFVGAIFALTRENMIVVILAQAVLAAGATLLVYGLGTVLRDRNTGLLAAGLFALDKTLIQNQSTLTAEALLMPAILLSLYAFVRYQRDDRSVWLFVGAAAAGLAFVTRNVAAIPLVAAILVCLTWWHRRDVGRLARDGVTVLAAIAIFSSPIALATYIREGSPRATTQIARMAWEFDGGSWMTISNNYLLDREIRPFEDPLGSLSHALADPIGIAGFYVHSVPQRLSTLLFFYSPGANDPLSIVNPVLYPNGFGDALVLTRLLGIAVAVIAIVRARWWRTSPGVTLLALYAVLYLAVFSLVFAPDHPFRYRIPIEPVRFIAEAAGVVIMVRAAGRLTSRLADGPRPQPA